MAQRLGRGVLAVVPVTSDTEYIYPFQVWLSAAVTGLRTDSKAQAEQIRAVDVVSIGVRVGLVPPELMRALDDCLRLQLDL